MKLAEKELLCPSLWRLSVAVLWGFSFSRQCLGKDRDPGTLCLANHLHFLSGQEPKGNK